MSFELELNLIASMSWISAAAIAVGAAGIVVIPIFCYFKFFINPGKLSFATLAEHFGGDTVEQGFLKYPIVFFSHDGIRFRVQPTKKTNNPDSHQLGLNISAEWPDPGFRMNLCRKTLFSRFQQPFSGLKVATIDDEELKSIATVFLEKEVDSNQVLTPPIRACLLRMLDSQAGIDRKNQDEKPGNKRKKKNATLSYQLFDLEIIAGRIELDCGIDFRKTDRVINLVEEFCDFYFLAVETTKERSKKVT